MERLNPLNDYLFLKLMGEEGDEEQCLAFLNAVLGSKSKRPVKLIKILENKTFTADVVGENPVFLMSGLKPTPVKKLISRFN